MNRYSDMELLGEGVIEGFIAPLIEGVLAYIITQMGLSFEYATKNLPHSSIQPSFTFSDLLFWFTLLILFEHIVIGWIGRMSMAVGYMVGAILSIFVYAGLVSTTLPNMAHETWGIIAIIFLGILVRLMIAYVSENKRNQQKNRDYSW